MGQFGNNVTEEETEGVAEYLVAAGSAYPCSSPGYFALSGSCREFWVCKEVGPGLLSAERPFRCPNRYLFDPITRLCQRGQGEVPTKLVLLPGQHPGHPSEGGPAGRLLLLPPHPPLQGQHQLLLKTAPHPLLSSSNLPCTPLPTP